VPLPRAGHFLLLGSASIERLLVEPPDRLAQSLDSSSVV
jgi:hypothetical protein